MATGMATPSFRDQRRGPPRSSGRSGPSYPRSQSGGMTKRNGAGSYGPIQSHPGNVTSAPCEDQANDDGFYSNVRMLGGVTQAVGRLVRVEVANGNIYEGILITVSKDFNLQVDQAKLLNKADGTMEKDVFSSLMFKKDDYISFKASEIDIRADTFLDSAISSTGRVNGQSNDPSKVKTLVQWDDDSESTGLSLEDAGTAGSNGWDADEMFSTNAAKFNVESSYEDSLAIYTTPLPKFRSAEEERKMRQFAEESARQIESTDGYRQRLEAENNPTVDEETKYSSVVREGEAKPASDRYVPPARRQAPSEQGQRGPPGGPSSQQPLPQREQRRERGDARQENRWDRPLNRGPHPMAQQPAHLSAHAGPPPQTREPPSDRLNGGCLWLIPEASPHKNEDAASMCERDARSQQVATTTKADNPRITT
ncbi:ataxin-2-like protein [Littorina saxatilis]|uniref:ataxin-2-like protein n=1 Tax=Littorina saxatilis TaxID=31220 RepID=UPI0038B4C9EA